jgi:hypothetical protein
MSFRIGQLVMRINYPAASDRGINSTTSHRRKPVSTNEPLDSGMRRNDGISSNLRGIQPAEIKVHRELDPGLLESLYEQCF